MLNQKGAENVFQDEQVKKKKNYKIQLQKKQCPELLTVQQ
jgi:hypothetical protein